MKNDNDLPRSLMLYTPVTLLLVRRCCIFLSSIGDVGEDDKPETAESILVSSAVSAAIVVVILILLYARL